MLHGVSSRNLRGHLPITVSSFPPLLVRVQAPLFLVAALTVSSSGWAAFPGDPYPLHSVPFVDGLIRRVNYRFFADTYDTSTSGFAVEVSGDLRPDLIQKVVSPSQGSRYLMAYGVGTYQIFQWLDEEASQNQVDAVPLPGFSDLGLDMVATVGSRGLVLNEWRPDALSDGAGFLHQTIDSSWNDVLYLVDVGSAGAPLLEGVTASGDLRTARYDPIQGDWYLSTQGHAFSVHPSDVVAVEWPGGGRLAGVFGDWIEIRDLQGVLVESIALPSAIRTVTAIEEWGQRQALAVFHGDGEASWMTVARPAGVFESALPLGLNAPTAAACGDLIPDGQGDLIFNSVFANVVIGLWHRFEGSASYGVTLPGDGLITIIDPLPWGPLPGMRSQPVIVDVDNDGDLDVFMGLGSRGDGMIKHSPLVSEAAMKVAYEGLVITPSLDGTHGTVEFDAILPQVFPFPGHPSALEVELYSLLGTEVEQVDASDIPLASDGPVHLSLKSNSPQDAPLWIVMRCVQRDSKSGRTLAAGPDAVHGIWFGDTPPDEWVDAVPDGDPVGTTPTPYNPGGPQIGRVPPAPPGTPFN